MEDQEPGQTAEVLDSAPKVEAGQRRKVRSCVPQEGVDLAVGQPGELAGAEPITFGRLFQKIAQEYPDVAALKWQEAVELPLGGEGCEIEWRTATYSEYYKSCVGAAKSFLKVLLEVHSGAWAGSKETQYNIIIGQWPWGSEAN